MTRARRATAQSADLRRQLERRLSEYFGHRRTIVSMTRRPCPYSSSFAIEEIDVCLEDGVELSLVMKDLSRQAMEESARRARPAFLYEPQREIHAYRDILPHAPAGTAAWYGAVSHPASGRYRLFLERVEGLELRHVGSFAIWKQTAAWSARFHTAMDAHLVDRLARESHLLVFDEAMYWRWLERARAFASRRRPGARRIVENIARRYEPVVRRLAALPRTVIHGEFYPCNVLIRQTGRRVRVCPVDWEMAAIGPGLMDLASLTTGWREREQRALIQAYRAAATAGGVASEARMSRELWRDFYCCRLHLAIRMLGWSDAWEPPPQHAHDWLAEAAWLAERIQG